MRPSSVEAGADRRFCPLSPDLSKALISLSARFGEAKLATVDAPSLQFKANDAQRSSGIWGTECLK
jgi:hypothetical protein